MTKKTPDEVFAEIRDYSSKMLQVQRTLLKFIDEENYDNIYYQNLMQTLSDQGVMNDSHKMREFLHLITEISINHHRSTRFFTKIERIIKEIRDDIIKIISNEEIFNIFGKNIKILLYLFKEKIIKPDINLISRLINSENSEPIQKCFFIPNNPLVERSKNQNISINAGIIRQRVENYGENNNHLCHIIQKDLIDEFVSFTSLKSYINHQITSSVYETNQFLRNKTPSIIEYSAFYGSIKIFKHVFVQNAEVNEDLWLYAIHGRNLEIIKEIERRGVDLPYQSHADLAIELIKCHHNELADFIINKRLNKEEVDDEERDRNHLLLLKSCLDSYNYEMFLKFFDSNIESIKTNFFLNTCYNDYFYIIELLLNLDDIDINAQTINLLFS